MRYVLLNIEHRQVRSSNVCVKRSTDTPWSTCSRLVQKKNGGIIFFLLKRLTIFGLFGGLWSIGGRWGHVFPTIANPRSFKYFLAMSPSFTVRWGQYHTKMCTIRIDDASGICEGENFRPLVSTKRPKHEK